MYLDLAKETSSISEVMAQIKDVERHQFNEIYVTLNKVPIAVTKTLAKKMLYSELEKLKEKSFEES